MRIKLPKLKPASRVSSAAHIFLNVLLAILILAIIVEPIALPWLAVFVFLLSKWRMLAVKPRHWPANIRSNLVDMTVGLSVIGFMAGTSNLVTQLVWVAIYSGWLLVIKPRSSPFFVSVQAMSAQTLGLIALFNIFSRGNTAALVVAVWVICYGSARHFFSAFEDENGRLISHVWALFGAQLAWVLIHWTLAYGFLPQIALLLTVVGYALAVCYYLHATDRLKVTTRNQFIFATIVVIAVVALFSEWQYSGL